jgi:hypothetical protein
MSSVILPERCDSRRGASLESPVVGTSLHKIMSTYMGTHVVAFQAMATGRQDDVEDGAEIDGASTHQLPAKPGTASAFLYTVGHGHTTDKESSDSDEDEEEIAARAQRCVATEVADGEALAAWVESLAADASIGEGVAIGGLIDIRTDAELQAMPDNTHGPKAVETLCVQHGIVYKRLPALAAAPAANQTHGSKQASGTKQWLSSVGAMASLKYCVGLAQNSELSWALLGVATDWQSCHRAHVADALCKTSREMLVWHLTSRGGLDAHRSSDVISRAHGRGGLGGLRGASLVDGGGTQKGGKSGKGSIKEKASVPAGGWQPAGLESQALAVHHGVRGQRRVAGKKSRRSIILDTVAIVFHHLLDETKRDWIVQWAT